MAPVIIALKKESWADVKVLATAQHRQMLDQILHFFRITPDIDLDIMQPGKAQKEPGQKPVRFQMSELLLNGLINLNNEILDTYPLRNSNQRIFVYPAH